MFLIRRKADGKYWGNPSRGHYDERWHDAQWKVNPNECRPFKTIGAAKKSRARYYVYNIARQRLGGGYPSGVRELMLKIFDEILEIVPVSVNIMVEK